MREALRVPRVPLLLAQVRFHRGHRRANGFDGRLQFFLRHAQRLGPVLELPAFVDVDAAAILRPVFLQIVRHGLLLLK